MYFLRISISLSLLLKNFALNFNEFNYKIVYCQIFCFFLFISTIKSLKIVTSNNKIKIREEFDSSSLAIGSETTIPPILDKSFYYNEVVRNDWL